MGTGASVLGVGQSRASDPTRAAAEAYGEACASLGAAPHVLLAFATAGYDPGPLLAALRTLAPSATIVGCSAEGVIGRARADEVDHALGLLALGGSLGGDAFLVPSYSKDSAAAGRELARQVRERAVDDPVALLVFPDGLSGDCDTFLRELAAGLPWAVPIVGGAAGDALRMERTHQYLDQQVVSGGVSALLLRGPARASVSVGHGCRPIGRTKVVTRADEGWVAELDGESAWDHFRSYLDGNPGDLSADGIMHLSVGHVVSDGQGEEEIAVRTPMLLRKSDGALFFPGGGLRVGTRLRMLRRDPEQITHDALAVGRRLMDQAGGRRPDLVLQFDCSGRGKLLFGSCAAEQLVRPVQEIVGPQVPWLGFHTYGEIATVRGAPRYHNYTVVFAALYLEERA